MNPKLKQETKEWRESEQKLLASTFWDVKGILLLIYLQTTYYYKLLNQLISAIRVQGKKRNFHQNNASPHTD